MYVDALLCFFTIYHLCSLLPLSLPSTLLSPYVCHSEEQQRRVDVSTLKYYVKVLINGREVAKSAEK